MKEVLECIEQLKIAMMSADASLLDRLTSSELSYGHTSGLIETKQKFIDAIAGDKVRDIFRSIELSDHTFTVSGNVVIARHRFQADVSVHGQSMQPDIRVMHVWQQEGGQWRLLARQAYKV